MTIIALVRDSAMMIGIYSLANKRVDDAFLAAVLTVIGYSVMDTIVILDRIRENTKIMAGEPFDKIVNTSILQTMTRSVNTLATVVITLVALLAFGGASLQNFAFALLVGICSGGYHSIFYSAPLVAAFQKTLGARAALRRAARSKRSRARSPRRARKRARDADRAEILAARKARRERERQSSRRAPAAAAANTSAAASKRPTTARSSARPSTSTTTILPTKSTTRSISSARRSKRTSIRSTRRPSATTNATTTSATKRFT